MILRPFGFAIQSIRCRSWSGNHQPSTCFMLQPQKGYNACMVTRLTLDRLKLMLYYDPELGWFMWLVAPQIAGRVRPGYIAGCLDSKGYVRVSILGRQYRAHRLAWFYMTGMWPVDEIDHEDRVRVNNQWLNLREATTGQNHQNLTPRSDNHSGMTGVSWAA